jgi:cation transport ATPase
MPHHKHSNHAIEPRHHVNLRLERWHRRCIYASCLVLLLSGALWLIARHFLRPGGQFGESIHPLEPWAIKIHGAGAMAMLYLLGSLMNTHIRRALKSGRNLISGCSMLVIMAVLTLTGFGLYYLAGESDRPLWSVVHWTTGLGLAVMIVIHVLLGRTSRHGRASE